MSLALWILTACALGLWSLAAWGLHRVLTSDGAWLAALPAQVQAWVETLPWGDTLDVWWPEWAAMLELAATVTQTVLGWLGDWALWIVWGVWGLGALMLLGTAALLAWLIRLARRTPSAAAKAQTPAQSMSA